MLFKQVVVGPVRVVVPHVPPPCVTATPGGTQLEGNLSGARKRLQNFQESEALGRWKEEKIKEEEVKKKKKKTLPTLRKAHTSCLHRL